MSITMTVLQTGGVVLAKTNLIVVKDLMDNPTGQLVLSNTCCYLKI